ncbi:hypothetical protein E4U33_004794 [Claviceps sp. LM78 group G4]|nr:hypothetical protein E4U33_004794 [Claviceps sp. LM78 group G4]
MASVSLGIHELLDVVNYASPPARLLERPSGSRRIKNGKVLDASKGRPDSKPVAFSFHLHIMVRHIRKDPKRGRRTHLESTE